MNHALLRRVAILCLLSGLAGCGLALPDPPAAAQPGAAAQLPVSVVERPLAPAAQPCSGRFVAHQLDHYTSVPGAAIEMFEANGAGVGVDDLDADGDLDVVLANHHGQNSILWNEGRLAFRTQRLPLGDSRAVNLVDVDADGWLDLVFTRRLGAPSFWRNLGAAPDGERFASELLPSVARPATAMAWGDLDADGDLDLVTGSYDAELLNELGNDFLFGDSAGVYLYERRGERFVLQRLARGAQALALVLPDLNGDRQPEIVVGNDFAVPDLLWERQASGWEAGNLNTMSHSTMSLDFGDIDNNGSLELFSTDMKPYDDSPMTLATWMPLMDQLWHAPLPGDPQIMENVLQVRTAGGSFDNQAYQRGVDATGWSWSGKFGDLDNDGFLDLYVVNGMAEARLFSYLPNHELVERNQALWNTGSGQFVPAPHWGLGATAGGRGMSMADLDEDGDLDIVVNNLRAPSQLFENQLCGGTSLQVELAWPDSRNTRALGASLVLQTSSGRYQRQVRAGSGYLSGDPARVHFGVPRAALLQWLEIHWPDGAVSTLDDLRPGALLQVRRAAAGGER